MKYGVNSIFSSNMPRYTNKELEAALDAVIVQGVSVNSAAKSFDIPESTLRHKIGTESKQIEKRGRQSFLTQDEEKECANRGKNNKIKFFDGFFITINEWILTIQFVFT